MRRTGPHFGDHPRIRSGVFYFLLLLIGIQGFRWGLRQIPYHSQGVQTDSLRQAALERLPAGAVEKPGWTLRPVDPNRLEDFQGYLLGIPFEALDSLYAFRSRGGRLYDLPEFAKVSGLADTTIKRLKPYLKFPRRPPAPRGNNRPALLGGKDLNLVTATELQAVSGIGPVLSRRIVKFREALGGFLHPSQLYDVYGLSPEVAKRVAEAFPLEQIPEVERVSLNTATLEELASLLYLTREMAAALIARRDSLGPYRSMEELYLVKSLPGAKIERIALYLKL